MAIMGRPFMHLGHLITGEGIQACGGNNQNRNSTSSGPPKNVGLGPPDLPSDTVMCENGDIVGVNKFIRIPDKSDGVGPSARSGHRAIADNSHMWVIGGFNPDHIGSPLIKELWKLNLTTFKWKLMPCKGDMPRELASHSALRDGHFMLLFGGTDYPFGQSSSNKVSVCNLKTCTWSVLQCSGSAPEKKYGQAIVVHDGKLYVHGGTSGYFYNNDLHALNFKTMKWSRIKPNNIFTEIPSERYRHEVAVCCSHLFVLGGGTSNTVVPLDKVHSFNFKTKRWEYHSTKPDVCGNAGYPSPRRCHGCVQLQDDAFISGGCDGARIMDDVWKLNLTTLQWTKVATMPEPVYFHSAAASPDGCMFVFGGISCAAQNLRTESCYRIWLRLPTLKNLCWQKLVAAHPQLLKMPVNKLHQIGVSENLIDRLRCPQGA